MQKLFIKRFVLIMLITVGLTLIANFFLQTIFSQKRADSEAADMIVEISERIEENNKAIQRLKTSLDENYITRANALSEIISENPEVVYSYDKMNRLAKRLRVDEVHVTDENGILRWGNVKAYYGLDFRKTNQTRPFLPALKDKTFELAQEPQPNGVERKLFQYISVARQDKTGIVQVGVTPKILDEALSNNKINVVIANFNVEKGNYVTAIDKKTGKVVGDTESMFIGKQYKALGIDSAYIQGDKKSGWIKNEGQNEFAVFGTVGNYIIQITYDKKLLFADRKNQSIAAVVSSVLLGMAIVIAIFILLKRVIIGDIKLVNKDLQKITNGDLGVVVSVKSTPEFVDLAGGINQMVSGLKGQMDEIAKQAATLQEQASRLEENNLNIMASLKYARKIQNHLLPDPRSFPNTFSDYAVLWEPKDLVGGDIYWVKEFEQGSVLCVCDCTGHGTPGALLTMLVISTLDTSVNEENCALPGEIMWELDQRLVSTLNASEGKKGGNDIQDGADLLIAFIRKDGETILASAKLRIFICDGENVQDIRGQKISIGDGSITGKAEIKVSTVPFNPNNQFYIATDGLFEQVGGENCVPYGYKKFKELIRANYSKNQEETISEIREALEEYAGGEERRDDITLIGWKIKV